MRTFRRILLLVAISALPAAAAAQTAAPKDFAGLANLFVQLITSATVLIIGLGVLYYLWGVVKGLSEAGSSKGRELLKKQVPWGIFILFVMFFIWAIIRVLQNTLFGSTNNFNTVGA